MDPSPNGPKAALRQTISDQLTALTEADRQRESAALVSFLEGFAPGRWTVVLATLPMAAEPSLVPFLKRWMAQGCQVALARTGPGRSLSFRYVASLDGPWDVKPYGMQEPQETAPLWSPGPPTLVLVPGLGFAAKKPSGVARLGRGAGYYDRWLAAHGSSVFALGVGYSPQWVDEVPLEPHDRLLDGWLGPQGFWFPDQKSKARTEG